MSTQSNTTTTAVSVTPTVHADTVQVHLQELRQMREVIPHFIMPVEGRETTKLANAASVSPEFVELTASATANHVALVRGDALSQADRRDLMSYADAYGPLADEFEAMAQFLRHSITAARNQVGADALTTYAVAKRLAKKPRYAGLAVHVADMRRALNRGKKLTAEQKAAKAAAKTPKPASPAQQTQ
jgi:hypothetical protein